MLREIVIAATLTALPSVGDLDFIHEQDGKLTVVVFLGVECPLSKLYVSRLNDMHDAYRGRVDFIAFDSNQRDTPDEIRAFAGAHRLRFPLLKDQGGRIAERFKATKNPEAFLFGDDGDLRYRGRIDDQFSPGSNRGRPGRRYLADAIDAVLGGKAPAVAETVAVGCIIDRVTSSARVSDVSITYCRDIAPLIHDRCVPCHRPGQVAPFPLICYNDVRAWSETIADVVRTGRMPPWGADPRYGRFANDRHLTDAQKDLILQWVDDGTPEGDPAELPPLPAFPEDGWLIDPDDVYSMPRPFTVPAHGILDYQSFIIDPDLGKQAWIQAVQIRPGNRSVVHHATLRARPRNGAPGYYFIGPLGDAQLAMYVPGQEAFVLPAGLAKRLPANWVFWLEVHYVTVGSVQTDLTQFGVVWADSASVQHEVATRIVQDQSFEIPAGEPHYTVSRKWTVDRDLTLLALFPHMHLRGKSMRFEAFYPDGTAEVLLNVPNYDFGWQHRYVLAEPKQLPPGTLVQCTGVYDNSADNPSNPDPSVNVVYGEQTTDEMFHGYFEVTLADEESMLQRVAHGLVEKLVSSVSPDQAGAAVWCVAIAGALSAAALWVVGRRLTRRLGAGSSVSRLED